VARRKMSHKQEPRNNKQKARMNLEAHRANIKKNIMKSGKSEILKKL
jgi:hypothetical protein